MSIQPQMMASDKHDWRTPQCILGLIVKHFGVIGLDPCAESDLSTHFARNNFTINDDGLSLSWSQGKGGGVVYVNPPYGRALPLWAEKCAKEHANGCEIIALVPARTDTKWFFICWDTATSICFWKRRITFVGAPANAPFPSAFIYWGDRPRRFRAAFEEHGKVVSL